MKRKWQAVLFFWWLTALGVVSAVVLARHAGVHPFAAGFLGLLFAILTAWVWESAE